MTRRLPQDAETDRNQVLLGRIAKIQYKADSLEQTTAFSLRKDSDQHMAEVRKIFGRSVTRVRVYLGANGSRNVQEISAHLNMKHPNVSVEVKKLVDEGFLEVVDTKGSGTVYAKTATARTLRIPAFLSRIFHVERDGRLMSGRNPRGSRKRRVRR